MLKYVSQEFISMVVPFKGQVGAGTVVPFSPGGTRKIFIPRRLAKRRIVTYKTCGDSFVQEHIPSGAVLICREDFEVSEVTCNRLVVVRLETNELFLKRIHFEGKKARLSCPNPNYKDLIVSKDSIEVLALVEISCLEHS